MLTNHTITKMSKEEAKKHKQHYLEINPYFSKEPTAGHLYPYGPHSSPYPFNYHYPYSAPPVFNSYPNSLFPPFSYSPYNYSLPPPSEHKKAEKKIKKEIIDVDSSDRVKEQYFPEQNVKVQPVQEQPVEQPKRKKREEDSKAHEEHGTEKYSAKTYILQKHFKKVLTELVSPTPCLQRITQQFQSGLREENIEKRSKHFSDNFFRVLWNKFELFKKTKEEMIKYIIRRTYHNAKSRKTALFKAQFQRLEQFHQRNLTIHKSMNNDFLRKQFSNKFFVSIYKQFLEQMDEQFERENEERINRFAITLASAWIEQSATIVQYEKKLPWVYAYKRKLKKIAQEMLRSYEDALPAVKPPE